MAHRTTLSLAAFVLTGLLSSACFIMSQPGEGESCTYDDFVPYCCTDARLCECIDDIVETFNCDQFCENIGYSDGGFCEESDIKPEDPYYFCTCEGLY